MGQIGHDDVDPHIDAGGERSPEHHCVVIEFLDVPDRWARSEGKDGVHESGDNTR
jgi:hypothetical protein